jgi:hypothetical protein
MLQSLKAVLHSKVVLAQVLFTMQGPTLQNSKQWRLCLQIFFSIRLTQFRVTQWVILRDMKRPSYVPKIWLRDLV